MAHVASAGFRGGREGWELEKGIPLIPPSSSFPLCHNSADYPYMLWLKGIRLA